MRQKDRGDLNLHFSAINSSTNSQNQQENRIWKIRFRSYLRWPLFFLKSPCSRKKTIEKKSRKHAKLWGTKTEKNWNSIIVPLTASPTLTINKKIDSEKWDFDHIFDDPSFFKNSLCSRKNRENMLNYEAKRQRRSETPL